MDVGDGVEIPGVEDVERDGIGEVRVGVNEGPLLPRSCSCSCCCC